MPSGEFFDEVLHIYRGIERESYRIDGAETANFLTLALVAKVYSMLKTHGLPRKQRAPTLTSRAKDFIDAH